MDEAVSAIQSQLRRAATDRYPVCIRGGGTKDFYGGERRGEVLNTGNLRGIVTYEPTELVITARAGTSLVELETTLQEQGQQLPFEPPHFDSRPEPDTRSRPEQGELTIAVQPPEERLATLGGCIAAGLSGPRRAYSGAARDFVLGVRILDGRANELRFGGQVMKNVAGYDISRLTVGAMGTLGVILDVSLKVLPIPAAETTLRLAVGPDEAIKLMNQWSGKPLPVTATAYRAGSLSVRLAGAPSAVSAGIKKIGGDAMAPDQARQFWIDLREHRAPFFAGNQPLWRLSVRSTTPPMDLAGPQIIEWGGALRWLRSDADPARIRDTAAQAGGHATLFRAGSKAAPAFHPLPPALAKLHRRLKEAFDPAGILNPGRLYPDF